MQGPGITGVGTIAVGEQKFLAGYNGTGAEVSTGAAVCWDVVGSDGKTFVLPTQTSGSNFFMFAGIVTETVGTGGVGTGYTSQIVAYGIANAQTYGITTTFIPGANMILTAGRSYVAYGTAGQFNGFSTVVQQPIAMAALQTHTTASLALQRVFVKAL